MDLDDVFDRKVAVAVAVTAAITSPPVRKAVRQGAVYSLAGMLMAGDRLSKLAGSLAEGAHKMAESARESAQGSGATRAANDQTDEQLEHAGHS